MGDMGSSSSFDVGRDDARPPQERITRRVLDRVPTPLLTAQNLRRHLA